MQGNAFQGAFFAASPVMSPGQAWRGSNCSRRSRRSSSTSSAARARAWSRTTFAWCAAASTRSTRSRRRRSRRRDAATAQAAGSAADAEAAAGQLRDLTTDIHRFWEQTGNFYVTGKGNDNLADPFIGLSFIPAATGMFRDMTGVRFEHPVWIPENCTACGSCYTVCPDSAIPGLVHSPLRSSKPLINRCRASGHAVKHLPRAVRTVEQKLRAALAGGGRKGRCARAARRGHRGDGGALSARGGEAGS